MQQISQTNPALLQMISQNQDAFYRMLTESSPPAGSTPATNAPPAAGSNRGVRAEESLGGQEGADGYLSPGVIHVTPQDKEAIERVKLKYYYFLQINVSNPVIYDAVFSQF